jgi:plastocyanin
MTFFPRELTINAGDTIFFDFKSLFSPHTVTFLSGQAAPPLLVPVERAATPAAAGGEPPAVMFNPAAVFPSQGDTYDGTGIANAGLDRLRPPDQPYTLTFTQPGAFDYLCLVHPKMMKGKVTVQAKGAAVPHEQAEVDTIAAQEMAQLLARGKALIAQYDIAASPTVGASNGNVWDVRAGAEDDEVVAARFFPSNLTIKAGDTVRWTDASEFEPHTVTFPGNQEPPDLIEPQPQAGGPPKLVFNPDLVGRRGPQVDRGADYANSGAMGADFKEFTGLTTYELTFAAPGAYPYYCALHGSPNRGMRAQITVT